MNNKCEETRSDLMLYFDGELSSEKVPDVEKHLKECESCQNELEQFQSVRKFLKTNPVPEHNQEYWEGLKKRIVTHYYNVLAPEKERKNIFQFLFSKPAFWVACLLVLFLITFIFKSNEKNSDLLVAYYPGEKQTSMPKLKSIKYSEELGNLIVMQPKGTDTLIIWFSSNASFSSH